MLRIDRLNGLYESILAVPGENSFFEKMLCQLKVQPLASEADLDKIPVTGPVVAIANHPFGFIEGAVLAAILGRFRPDVRIMANSLLGAFPKTDDRFIYVNPFGGSEAVRDNQRGLRTSLLHLKKGGMLVIFPAGEVASVNLKKRAITDPEWNSSIARIVRITNASVLPMFFSGANSPLFHLLGMIHPRVRTALLPHELFNKRNKQIEVRIGSVIPGSRLQEFEDDEEMMAHLRRRVYFLQHRDDGRERKANFFFPLPQTGELEAMIQPVAPELLACEVGALPADRLLDEMGGSEAYYATASEIPNVLLEIGRLRELTFREVGEGTGRSIDLDEFDSHYLHLFVWNRDTQEVVGAYRLGPTDTITSRFGIRGLYTSTLFNYKGRFLNKLGIAMEMGRSFVRPEYQKSFTPLLLLWKGIGTYIARNPQYKILFGPVSISNNYQPMSRQLMVTFFKHQSHSEELKGLVRARSPFRINPLKKWNEDSVSMGLWDIEDLSALVADIETDQKGIPVLLRQYLKLGGRLLGFNVDRNFADALDGLIMVDLTKTDPKMLQRYLGKEGAARFLEFHSHCDPRTKAS